MTIDKVLKNLKNIIEQSKKDNISYFYKLNYAQIECIVNYLNKVKELSEELNGTRNN